jgi:hypothetical protein
MAKQRSTGLTMFQQIRQAKFFRGFGRRQKRRLAKCHDEMPTAPLIACYKNGTTITYRPSHVEGQLLICNAYVSTPELPQEVFESNVAVSLYEFPDEENRKIFKAYHSGLMARQCLCWEDGAKVRPEEMLAQGVRTEPVLPPLREKPPLVSTTEPRRHPVRDQDQS